MFAADLLSIHASGARATLPERALLLAALAEGLAEGGEIDDTEPMGRTLARILPLHRDLAGPDIAGTVSCPECGATAEFALPVDALAHLAATIDRSPRPLDVPGAHAVWRPIGYGDLVAAAAAPTSEAGVATLLERCIDGPSPEGELRAALVTAMAAADPLAEVQATLQCPECEHALTAAVEVADFVWTAVDAEATRLMIEVDVLARVYSWSEADIIAMPASRRSRYLALATGGA